MEFKEFFQQMKTQFQDTDISQIQDKLAIQINLTGTPEEAGTFYIEVKDGVLSIEPYEYNDRNVSITLSVQNFVSLMSGKLDPIFAFTTGKLKAEGDVGRALELKKFIK